LIKSHVVALFVLELLILSIACYFLEVLLACRQRLIRSRLIPVLAGEAQPPANTSGTYQVTAGV
jgi:hypothetical protein